MTQRTCSDCGKGITAKNLSGVCRSCRLKANNADPAFHARRVAGIRKRYEDPAARAKAAREIHARHLNARKRPEVSARLEINLAKARARLNDPDARANFLASRPAAGRKRSATLIAWCPEEYRGEYRRLVRSKRMHAKDAKALILAKLTRFERQMHALQQGARLIEKPILCKSAPDYTLGGVTDWAA